MFSSKEKNWNTFRDRKIKSIMDQLCGVSRENFVYYLKELKFRHNNKEKLDEMLHKVLNGKF